MVEEDKIFATKSVNTKLNEVAESAEDDLDNHVIQPVKYSTMVRESPTTTSSTEEGEDNEDENNGSTTTESSTEESFEDSTAATASKLTANLQRPLQKRVLNNVRRHQILEDQISSESQNEEILPSSTLLVQTSFTTFTFFTTQYGPSGDSEVLSRLETVTNVITQTLQPTQTVIIAPPPVNDEQVPTTYFTTFTFWTTLFKDGEVITTSNTQIKSQIVTNMVQPTATQEVAVDEIVPTARVPSTSAVLPSIVIGVPSIVEASTLDSSENAFKSANNDAENSASIVTPTPSLLEPTTYYITYTCK